MSIKSESKLEPSFTYLNIRSLGLSEAISHILEIVHNIHNATRLLIPVKVGFTRVAGLDDSFVAE
jgi:hypothetical protein